MEDDDFDPEGPDEADMSDEPATVTCPYCKREVLEDSIGCPHCGNYLPRDDDPEGRGWWWVVGLIVLMCLLIAFFLRR